MAAARRVVSVRMTVGSGATPRPEPAEHLEPADGGGVGSRWILGAAAIPASSKAVHFGRGSHSRE